MPIPGSCLGRSLPDVETFIDTRWIMSYAAGLGDTLPQYLDSAMKPAEIRPTNDFHVRGMQGGGVIAHPVFCWAVEWPITWLQMGSMYAPDLSKGETGMQSDEVGGSTETGLCRATELCVRMCRPAQACIFSRTSSLSGQSLLVIV